MPLTRNQRISRKCSPTQRESPASLTETNESKTPDPDAALDGRSPSSALARLRDRRSLAGSATIKSSHNGESHQTADGTNKPSSSPINRVAKRLSLVAPPTRLLPKRLCDKSDSSWAREQQPTLKQLTEPVGSKAEHSDTSKIVEVIDLSSNDRDDQVIKMPRSVRSTAEPGDVSQTEERLSPITRLAQDNFIKQTISATTTTETKTPATDAVNLESNRNTADAPGSTKSCPIGFQPINYANKTSANNSKTDTNKCRSPVRITLPINACANQLESSDSSPKKGATPNELESGSKRIEFINFNNSLLRKNSTIITTTSGSVVISESSKSKSNSQSQAIERDSLAEKNFNVLIAVTGSVAAVKLIELIKKLKAVFPQAFVRKTDAKNYKATISIKILLTENSKHFVGKKQIIDSLNDPNIVIHDDADEWSQWKKMGDPVLHIELRKWADIMVIAPIDANTMAKISNGICDNLLTCVVRAWDVSKRLIYCPAMNVHMYNHPITREQLCKLQSFGYLRVDSIEKRLACGDVGMGAMATVESIVDKIVENLLRPVARVISPSKSILNQQPTYPIISTSNSATSPTKPSPSVNILDRFKSNSQVSLHAVANKHVTPRLSAINSRTTINGLSQLERSKSYALPPMNLVVSRNLLPVNNRTIVPAPRTYSDRPNFVTSLQNLKAINSNTTVVNDDIHEVDADGNDEGDDDAIDLSTPEDEDGFSNDDFDASGMMEQSLITDDSIFSNDKSCNLSSQMNGSSTSSTSYEGFNKSDNLTPLFNTQKFLALCFDKSRDCFTCAICKNDYKNRKSMARHLKEQHVQGNIFQCLSCGVGYKRREKLIKHNRERHGTDQLCRSNFIKPKT